MKAILAKDAYRWVLADVPDPPPPGPGEVLVEVRVCGICGSDLHDYKGKPSKDRIPGHELAGVVLEVGEGVKNVKVGDRVVLNPVLDCGECRWCVSGQPNLCPQFKGVIGCQYDGGFAEKVRVPAKNLLLMPQNVDFRTATLCDPVAVMLNGLDLIDLSGVERVAVFGLGALGMSAAISLTRSGYEVYAVDIREFKLQLAREIGLEKVVDGKGDVIKAIGGGLDLCIDAVGSGEVVNLSLRLLRKGGTLLALGIAEKPVQFSWNGIVFGQIRIQGVFAHTRTTFRKALRMFASDERFQKLVTHCFKLDQFDQAIQTAMSGDAVKVVVEPS
ncbi:alcohol dehydrogenase catalytic domain-containing protein [Candidatus Poribacteria bacterium]|nr:alcohol dehydrogenase catalytic domain-containing protein [Candidatus Poribacteria bacterium]